MSRDLPKSRLARWQDWAETALAGWPRSVYFISSPPGIINYFGVWTVMLSQHGRPRFAG